MFEEKVTDIVGLYLDIRIGPPHRAAVRCVDEASQIQASDRTRPGLPLGPGRAATPCRKHAFGMMTRDCKRHGTTTLFAALDVKSGLVIPLDIACRDALPDNGRMPAAPPAARPRVNSMIALRDVSKSFGATHAVTGVSFTLQAGEVHALVGENMQENPR